MARQVPLRGSAPLADSPSSWMDGGSARSPESSRSWIVKAGRGRCGRRTRGAGGRPRCGRCSPRKAAPARRAWRGETLRRCAGHGGSFRRRPGARSEQQDLARVGPWAGGGRPGWARVLDLPGRSAGDHQQRARVGVGRSRAARLALGGVEAGEGQAGCLGEGGRPLMLRAPGLFERRPWERSRRW